jgi:poly(glycerol-phosphate) alpha-glucosyltransferase
MFESVRRLHQSLAQIPSVNVTILGLEDEYTKLDLGLWQPLRVECFPVMGPKRFGYSPRLASRLFGMPQDIIHTHGLWMYMSSATARCHRIHNCPYMISPHGMLDAWALRNSRWKKWLARLLYEDKHLRHAACLRALCLAEADSMRALGLRNPICIIPNGIDLPKTVNGFDKRLIESKRPRPKELLYLGRLHPKKGLVNLLKAWALVRQIRPEQSDEWLLKIAGWDQDGHQNQLKRLASYLNIQFAEAGDGAQSHYLRFEGPLFGKDKENAYQSCDAFILPSFSEGLPIAVLEAWAHAKPVLMTPECNLPEGFTAQAALRVESNAESIAGGLKTLFDMSDADLRAMGACGLDLVRKFFHWPTLAAEMKAVYDWVLGHKSKPDCVQLQ